MKIELEKFLSMEYNNIVITECWRSMEIVVPRCSRSMAIVALAIERLHLGTTISIERRDNNVPLLPIARDEKKILLGNIIRISFA